MTKSLLQTSNARSRDIAPLNRPFFRAVMEGFSEGILILTATGDIVHSNRRGQLLCQQIGTNAHPQGLPEAVWALCRYLIDSQEIYAERPVVLSQPIATPQGTIGARVQWFQFDDSVDAYLMVTLEDQAQAAKALALFEAQHFQLTERETEVWILRKANRSYEEIAQELFITANTVKRHLKSIYAKRKQVLAWEEA